MGENYERYLTSKLIVQTKFNLSAQYITIIALIMLNTLEINSGIRIVLLYRKHRSENTKLGNDIYDGL